MKTITFFSLIFLAMSRLMSMAQQLPAENMVVAVAPVKMNVFYMNVDNPLRIAVAGVPASKVHASINQGAIRGSNGVYLVNVIDPEQLAVVKVSVEDITGKPKVISSASFRVKNIPPIRASFMGIVRKGTIEKSKLLLGEKVDAIIPDFPFDLSFVVTSFKMVSVWGDTVNSLLRTYESEDNRLTPEMKNGLIKASKGSHIYIEDAWAKPMVEGANPVPISPLTITVE